MRLAAGAVGAFAVVGLVIGSLAMVGASTPARPAGSPPAASDTGASSRSVDPATRAGGSPTSTTTTAPTTTTTVAAPTTTSTTQPVPAIGAPAHGVCPSGFCYTTTTTTTAP